MRDMTDAEYEAAVDYWAIHSQIENRPTIRGYAKSKAAAQKRLEEIRTADAPKVESEYWITQLNQGQLESLKDLGVIPQDA